MVGKLSLLLLIKRKSGRMMRGIFTLVFCLGVSYVFGQANNSYRTRASGNWTSVGATGIWERYNLATTTWVNATTPPTNTNAQAVAIRVGHTVTVSDDRSIDQVTL